MSQPQRKYTLLQLLLQHCEELEQLIPEPTQARPAGTPLSRLSLLTSPLVICTLSAADSVRDAEAEVALRTSRAASIAAAMCMLLMGIAPAMRN